MSAPKTLHTLGLAAALALAGCHNDPPKTEDIRPVRALKIAADNVDVNAEFAGEVRPRVVLSTASGFGGTNAAVVLSAP